MPFLPFLLKKVVHRRARGVERLLFSQQRAKYAVCNLKNRRGSKTKPHDVRVQIKGCRDLEWKLDFPELPGNAQQVTDEGLANNPLIYTLFAFLGDPTKKTHAFLLIKKACFFFTPNTVREISIISSFYFFFCFHAGLVLHKIFSRFVLSTQELP